MEDKINWKGLFIVTLIVLIGIVVFMYLKDTEKLGTNEGASNNINTTPTSSNANTPSNVNTNPSSASQSSQNKPAEDTLITQCRSAFNECNDIVDQKYNRKYTLIKMEKFETLDGAADFFKTWSTFAIPITDVSVFLNVYCGGDCNNKLPLILIAYKGINMEMGTTVSAVAFCDKSGELTSYSKTMSGC
ncbi:MAG: hypothetical protein PHH54_02580 [Candidatus Nanoarchaeia archaeon]|nr:hypothetical protein [Candidatus Nanoarchaeia archaeon]MDD5740847.1 hypothetical protein [Candidatus Nanoarchaeia archaeon]